MSELSAEDALNRARDISVLMTWIEEARFLIDGVQHMQMLDETLRKRLHSSGWFTPEWEECENGAFQTLLSYQRELIHHAEKRIENLK